MGWKARCGIETVSLNYLQLNHNRIKHMSDVLHGWRMNIKTVYCLAPHRPDVPFSYIGFENNNMKCDCVDFDILKLIHIPYMHTTTALDDTFCSGPVDLAGTKVLAVPLDQLVCELTERCPPGCRCVHRPANATLHVYCSNTNLTAVPFELPKLPKSYTKYKLDFCNNRGLYRLEHRDYFIHTSILDVSNCNVDSVDLDIWNDLANISQVFLDGNQLQSLPSWVAAVNLERTHFSIGRNPWKCSCDASWMSSWLKSVSNSLITESDITCFTPSRLRSRNIMSLNREMFCVCVDPISEAVERALTISISSTAGVGIAIFPSSLSSIVCESSCTPDGSSIRSTVTSVSGKTWTTMCFSHAVPTTTYRTEMKFENNWNSVDTTSVTLPEIFSLAKQFTTTSTTP